MSDHVSIQRVRPGRYKRRAVGSLDAPLSRNAMFLREILVDPDGELLTADSVGIRESSGVPAIQAARTAALPGVRRGVQSVSCVEGVRLGHGTQKLPDVSGRVRIQSQGVPDAGAGQRTIHECASRTKFCLVGRRDCDQCIRCLVIPLASKHAEAAQRRVIRRRRGIAGNVDGRRHLCGRIAHNRNLERLSGLPDSSPGNNGKCPSVPCR